MPDDIATRAFEDLDQIAEDADRALDALFVDDVDEARDILTDIQERAEAWNDP